MKLTRKCYINSCLYISNKAVDDIPCLSYKSRRFPYYAFETSSAHALSTCNEVHVRPYIAKREERRRQYMHHGLIEVTGGTSKHRRERGTLLAFPLNTPLKASLSRHRTMDMCASCDVLWGIVTVYRLTKRPRGSVKP
jgi:hypothetical protein